MTISPRRGVSFAEDPAVVYFGIQEATKADGQPAAAADPTKGKPKPTAGSLVAGSLSPVDKPDLVIWHWNDERLQSQQEKEAGRDRFTSYLCTYQFKAKKFLRLADDSLRQVMVAPKGRWAIG